MQNENKDIMTKNWSKINISLLHHKLSIRCTNNSMIFPKSFSFIFVMNRLYRIMTRTTNYIEWYIRVFFILRAYSKWLSLIINIHKWHWNAAIRRADCTASGLAAILEQKSCSVFTTDSGLQLTEYWVYYQRLWVQLHTLFSGSIIKNILKCMIVELWIGSWPTYTMLEKALSNKLDVVVT